MPAQDLRVVAITGGKNVPSRRYRIDALVSYVAESNIELVELCPTISRYPPKNVFLRFPWLVAALLERFSFLYRAKGYDAVILQRELISTLPTLERLLPKPRILDVDDAIFLRRGGRAAEYAARSCSLVVCGNSYLAEKFSQWNSNVVVIPTGVDTEKLRPLENRDTMDRPIIGWIGTSRNYHYLKVAEPAIKEILSQFPQVRLQIISDEFPTFLKYLGDQLDYRAWAPDIEFSLLPRFTIGIMPLTDSEWARGKCAFKMLQYMAAGVPVVVSPVGVNKEIMDVHNVGLAAADDSQWLKPLRSLLESPDKRYELGQNGRQVVESEYSLRSVSDKWAVALSRLLER